LTTRSAEAIRARRLERCSPGFGDWQRYRSAFNEAIGLPAMSEHLPGVTMTVQLAVSRERAASAERSSPGRISSSIVSFTSRSSPPHVWCHAACLCSPWQVNTRLASKTAPDRYQPQIIFTILRPTAVIALAPGIFWTPVLWW